MNNLLRIEKSHLEYLVLRFPKQWITILRKNKEYSSCKSNVHIVIIKS